MDWWGKIIALFLLGAGTSLFVQNSLVNKSPLISDKPIEVTKEATSTATVITPSTTEQATVKRVIDGDTIELTDSRRVRYIGINTPEVADPRRPVECFGKEASLENKILVEGKEIRMEKDISQTDTFGRLLRYIYVGPPAGGLFVNDYLVRQGFANASTFPPDVKYTEQFRQAEQEARENNRGLWSGCSGE